MNSVKYLIKIFFIVFLSIIFSSCFKQIIDRDFDYNYNMNNKLPFLKTYFNIGSFQTHYLKNISEYRINDYYNQIPDSNLVISCDSIFNLKLHKRVEDAIFLVIDNFKLNIFSNNDTSKSGYIVVKLTDFNSRSKYKILYIPHLAVLGLLMYLNVPLYYYESVATINISFYDKNNKLISSYSGNGKSSVPISLYGYFGSSLSVVGGDESGVRKSNIDCIKQALNVINDSIKFNFDKIAKCINK